MSRIKHKKQGVNNMLVFTNQDNSTGTITFNGSVFSFSAPVTLLGAQTLLPNGTAAAPSLAFTNTPGMGMYRSASNVIGFSTAGSERVTIDAQGDINVGTYISIGNGGTGQIVGDKKPISEAAATPLTAAMSGSVFFVNSDTAASAFTLPTAVAGLHYKWVWTADCDAAITIVTSDITDTTGEMITGGLLFCAAAAVNTFVEALVASNLNTITLDNNVNEVRGGAGTWIELIATEAKTWYLSGIVNGNVDATDVGSGIITNAD